MKKILICIAILIAIGAALYGADRAGWFTLLRIRLAPAPNVLLLTIDATRTDRLGCYGYAQARTPAIDAITAEGVLFEEMTATATWTQPSVASLLTGKYPAYLGIQQAEDRNLSFSRQEATLAEILKDAGYATAAFTDNGVLGADFGYDQGFDTYYCVLADNAETVTGEALKWLEANGKKRFFVWIHFLDPHEPYVLREYEPFAPQDDPARERDVFYLPYYLTKKVKTELDRHYDSEIRFVDRCIAMLADRLKAVGAWENTLIAVTADHGESLGEIHGDVPVFGHGDPPYEEQVRIPFILRYPAILPAGKRVAGQFSLVDFVPTIAELTGVNAPPGLAGKSLLPCIFRGADCGHAYVFSQSFQEPVDPEMSMRLALRTPRFKLFSRPNLVLSDVFAIDPETGQELPSSRSAVGEAAFDEMEAVLMEYVKAWSADERAVSEEVKERLRAMGYISDSGK